MALTAVTFYLEIGYYDIYKDDEVGYQYQVLRQVGDLLLEVGILLVAIDIVDELLFLQKQVEVIEYYDREVHIDKPLNEIDHIFWAIVDIFFLLELKVDVLQQIISVRLKKHHKNQDPAQTEDIETYQ